MTDVAVKNTVQIRQHQAIHAHMRFTITAVGKLDLKSCLPHIADSKSLKSRIALYRWSLDDLKKAIQRDNDLNQLVFSGEPFLKSLIKENHQILEQINSALVLAANAAVEKITREELNVILVKINLAVNALCETMKLNIVKQDAFSKSQKTSANSLTLV